MAKGHFFGGALADGHYDTPQVGDPSASAGPDGSSEPPEKRQLPQINVTPSGVKAEKINSNPVTTEETPETVTMQNKAPNWEGKPTEFKKSVKPGGFVKDNPVDPSSGEHYELSDDEKAEADKTSDFTNEPANAMDAAGEVAGGLRKDLPEAVAKQGRLR